MIFSVIVPFLDEEAYLGRCLVALLDQDIPREDYEIILVDNGSRDGSAAVARSFPGVTLIRHPVPNVYAARNKALRMARGRIIALTDADCEVSRGWLRAIRSGLEGSDAPLPSARRNSPRTYVPGPASLRVATRTPSPKVSAPNGPREYIFASANNMAVQAEAFSPIRAFRRTGGRERHRVRPEVPARPTRPPGSFICPKCGSSISKCGPSGRGSGRWPSYGRLIARTPGYRPSARPDQAPDVPTRLPEGSGSGSRSGCASFSGSSWATSILPWAEEREGADGRERPLSSRRLSPEPIAAREPS